MNEEALQQLYTLAQGEGYSKSFDEFKTLMGSNEDALNNMYSVSQGEGYKNSIDNFKVLVGFGISEVAQEVKDEFNKDPLRDALKKKDVSESVLEDGLSASQRKSKEIFEQIGGPSWRGAEEEMPLTEQSIAQMESPVDEAPSRSQMGTVRDYFINADLDEGRLDLKEAKEIARISYEPTEEEVAITSIKLSNLDKGIVTPKDIEVYQEEERKEEQVIQEVKTSLIDIYNSIASQENLETISIKEYSNLFEDKSNADAKLFKEFNEQVGDDILSQDEINEIDKKNAELISKGEEPVSYDDYIVLKKNKLFNQYVIDKNLLPSQKRKRVIQDLIDVNSRLLLPSKDFDFTVSLNDEARRDNAEKIHSGKLKRDFIIENISSDLYVKNEGKVLTPQAYEEVYSKATENFYKDFGEKEWETYKKISGNTDPLFVGTEYENDNQENSFINSSLVVIGDEAATVENLQRVFPEFRIEGSGRAGEYITISTVAPDGGTVKSLEVYLEEENEPVRRIREFMQGAFLSKKDKAFLNKDYDTDDPLWKLEVYDHMLSNPQKFGDTDSPSMYATKRAIETVDFDEVNQFLDRHKGKISDEMVKSLRIKMAQADAYYKRELAQKGSVASAIVSGVMTAATASAKFVTNQIANIYDAFGGEGAKEAKDGMISSIESMQNQVSGTTPESIAERDLLQTVLNTMASSGGAMVLGMGNPYATFGSFLMQSSTATERLLKDEDIPEYQKGLIGVLMGTVEGVLETYGAQKLISPASSGLFKKLIINSIKDLPADASQETIERAIKNSVKTKLLSGGLKVAEGMIYEGATEGTQGIADDLNKRLFNTIYEKEIFQVPDWTTDEGRRQWAEQIVEQVKLGALSGGGFAGAIHGTKSLAKGFQNKGDNKRFNEEYEGVMNNSTFQKRRAEFKIARAANEITEEQLQVLDNQINESREIMQSIPETLSTNRKRQAYNLLTEKRALERSMQNKSPDLVAARKDRIKDIDAQLKIVGNEEVAEDVIEEQPSKMEQVTRWQEIENLMNPKQAPVVEDVVEDVVEETPITEEAPVTEEERTKMQEVLETQPITKITTDLVAKEKKGELTQEETDGVLLGIMEKIEAENAKRKSPLSPEQAQKKLGKVQQRIFEGNKQRYLELSGAMPAAQEQVVEEAPVVEQVTEEVVQETPKRNAKVFDWDNLQEQPLSVLKEKLEEAEIDTQEKDQRRSDMAKSSVRALKAEIKIAQEQVVKEAPVVEEAPILSENQTKNIKIQEQVIEEAPVVEKEELEYGENTFVYKMSRSRTPSGRGRWEADFEIIDNRDGVSFGKEEGKWVVYNRITNTSVTVDTKKDAQSIIKNAPADGGLFNDGQQVDFSNLTESEQKKFKKQFEAQKIQRKRKKIGERFAKKLAEEAPIKKEAPKRKTPKRKAPKISEEVQKEIEKVKKLRDNIVVDKRNEVFKVNRNSNLTREQRSERREELQAEERQAEKRYNNIITELKEGKRTRFRLSDDATVETEGGFITEDDIVEGMKKLGPVEKGFKIPSGIKEGDVDPIAQSKSTKKITDAQAKKLGFESVSDMLKNIQEFNGIPMIVAMSDVLASGVVKDSMGKKMKVDGGLLYNILGSNTELAWAGVNETGAEVQFREAQQMYRANKELFDRLWKEGKLPQNHVPMVVLRMGNSAVNSNEAMFRYLAPLIKSFPKQNQDEAFSVLMESIEGKKNVSQENKSGRDTVKSAEQLEEVINKNNITDVGSLFDFIVKDAKKRAKGDGKNTIPLPTRALLFDLVVSPVGVKKPSKGVAKALIKDTQSEGKEFLADKILSDIGETSMMESESGDAVAIMGVDVINGGVRKANHNNYGFGPKGRLIALIKNPMNGLDIFPEWRAKAVRVFKKDAKGEMPTLEKVLRQVGGAFFIDKAFRGARVQTEQSDIDVISGKMRFAFPGVSVSQTQQEFDEALKQEGIRTAESNGNTILGLTKDGKIFLNPSRKSLSTPIHEFGHIWIDFLRSESSKTKGTKLLKKGLELVEGTKALESAIKKYGDNELAREEALVELMGTKGETIANAAKRAKFIEWFNAFFKYIKEKLTRFKDVKVKDIKDISLEDFVDIGLAELFSGQAVDASSKVKFKPEEAAESAKARMQIIGEKGQVKPSMSAQNIIKRARAAEIRDAVIVDYLMSEKGLTRNKAINAIKRANRGDLKDAVKRLFNNVEDITDIKEKDAQLIKDILKFDRSITRADKMAQKKAKNEIKSRLKAIQRASKGKLSQAQLLAVTNRFTNVNLSSEKSIDSFVDYMQKVFSDVDYAAKMTSLNKSIKQANKNINSRIGRGADGLAYELKRLLNISPTIIPDSVLDEYSDLVTSFGERKTVLNLKDSAEVKETIANIFTELENQNSKLGELNERFEAFEKVEKDGKVDYAKTVKKMLNDKAITEEESKLMKKFRAEINPIEKAEGKTEEEKLQEMEEEKQILLESVKSAKVDIERIGLTIERALVKDFARLIKTDAINDLNNAQLKNIQKAVDNINNGYVTHYVQLASENLESINKSKVGAEGIRDAKPLAVSTQIAKIKTLYQKGSDANKFYKLIERNPLINIDMVLGDFTSKRIFNSVLEESAEAVTTFNTELNKVYNTLEEAEVALQKKFKNNGTNILESKYKQMAYMVQKEFESNPDNKQVNRAAEVIEATIKKLRDSNQKYEADILEGILENYSTDGQIDLKKLEDSFVYAELNMIKVIQEINSKLTDKATYTASVIRGEAIQPLNDYIHQPVLNTDGVAMDDSRALSENYMANIKPSTKAKNLIERTKGVKAINFDITASVRRGAKMTLMDYHLTAPLRTANRTLNKMEKQLDEAGQQRQIFLAVRDAYNQGIADILENNFTSSGIGEQMFQYAAKQGYRSMLASIPRVFVELSSNYAFALNNPVEFAEGSKPKNMKIAFSERGVEVMNNTGSKQTARMYGEGLSGRFVESSMINKKMGMSTDSAKNPVVNRLNQGLSYLKKYPRGVEVVADFMITTPDKLVTRPMWFGSFATEFKKITGQEVDFNKIADNDAKYMEEFEDVIKQAKRKADDNSVLIGATDNPLMGILKNKKRASDGNFKSGIKIINTFMQRFLLFEYNAFRKGMYAAMGRGDISRGRGVLLMTAVSARMTIYTALMPILSSLMFGGDDDDDESLYTKVYRAMISTLTNIFIGRDFGAIVKMIQNGFIEMANKEYGEDLGIREGEYDPFKNQVQFNIIPPEKSYKETDIASDILPNMLGPYTPLVKSILFSLEKIFLSKPKIEEDARERQRREKEERIPLELLGLTGLVPFYKDIRKALNEDIYKGLRDKDNDDEETEDGKKKKKKKKRRRRKEKKKN